VFCLKDYVLRTFLILFVVLLSSGAWATDNNIDTFENNSYTNQPIPWETFTNTPTLSVDNNTNMAGSYQFKTTAAGAAIGYSRTKQIYPLNGVDYNYTTIIRANGSTGGTALFALGNESTTTSANSLVVLELRLASFQYINGAGTDTNLCSVNAELDTNYFLLINYKNNASTAYYYVGDTTGAKICDGNQAVKTAGTISRLLTGTNNSKWVKLDNVGYSSATNPTASFTYTINKTTQTIDLNDLSSPYSGKSISYWLWEKNGTTLSTDQNTSFSATQLTDYNICLTVTDNTDLNSYSCSNVNAGRFYGDGNFWLYDENSGAPLTGVTIDWNGTPQTLSGSSFDFNFQGITSGNYTFTLTKTGYGTRYYQIDLNQYSDFNKSFALLPDSNGSLTQFRFFAPDQTTIISEQYIEVLDYITGQTLGRRKTTSDGDVNFFLNLNDANIHFLLNQGVPCYSGTTTSCDYNTVILTVKKPKDEDTGIDINATWNVIISGLASQSVLSTSNASHVFALYSNTVETYRVQIDSNGTTPITPFTYTSRVYLLNFYGNPLTATLQPYLLPTSEVVLTKLNTLQQTSLGITSLPGIVIKVYKSIPGQGVQLIQQVQTDGKGQAAVTLKTGDAYTFNLYQNGALLAFNQQTSIPINVITTTISFTISVGGSAPSNPTSKGVFINWEPTDNSTPYLPSGTTWDINQYLFNKSGESYTAVLHAYVDGNELLIGGVLPKTTTSSINTIVYNNIPWNQLTKGNITFVMNITQSDGNAYAYTMTYTLFTNDSNISGTTYTFDILEGLRTGLRTDLGYNATELCPPLLGLALLIIFGSLGILTIKIGSFGGQGTVGMALVGMAFFTYLNWIPMELTAIAFILGGAFIINDANLR
jgi:hypothetical protein